MPNLNAANCLQKKIAKLRCGEKNSVSQQSLAQKLTIKLTTTNRNYTQN